MSPWRMQQAWGPAYRYRTKRQPRTTQGGLRFFSWIQSIALHVLAYQMYIKSSDARQLNVDGVMVRRPSTPLLSSPRSPRRRQAGFQIAGAAAHPRL